MAHLLVTGVISETTAATALGHGLVIVTPNLRDSEWFEGLHVEHWFDG